MAARHRSGCPINLAVEVLGDRWSLIVLRDIVFGGKRHFRELHRSEEGIAFNILADRLRKLVELGLLTKAEDPHHKQKAIYSLTAMSIDLVPVFVQLGLWAYRYLPVSDELSARTVVLGEGGPQMWARFQQELRAAHLSGDPVGGEETVAAAMEAAYRAAVERNRC